MLLRFLKKKKHTKCKITSDRKRSITLYRGPAPREWLNSEHFWIYRFYMKWHSLFERAHHMSAVKTETDICIAFKLQWAKSSARCCNDCNILSNVCLYGITSNSKDNQKSHLDPHTKKLLNALKTQNHKVVHEIFIFKTI